MYGVVGNPVAHSRSPALHNAAFQAAGVDGMYMPLLVDDLPTFLASFDSLAFQGLSVTIPHKVSYITREMPCILVHEYMSPCWLTCKI